MTHALALPPALRAQLFAEALAASPLECCGLIEGVEVGDVVRAIALHPATNLSSEQDRFEIDPAVHFALLHRLRGSPHRVVGCYHSHPKGRGEPSARDLAGAGEEGFIWLIAGIRGQEFDLGAYQYRSKRLEKLSISADLD
jgi:proteasome lid subunit RPN8/RPN11